MANITQHVAFDKEQRLMLEGMHKLLLETLRHREQEIFQYLVILGPALGGFILLYVKKAIAEAFIAGTIGVLFSLLLGAFYSLSLGFNFRYIVLELAKLETILGVRDAMLNGWPRKPEEFVKRYKKLCFIPWCTPPEIINFFYWAFLCGILGVTLMIWHYKPDSIDLEQQHLIQAIGLSCFAFGFFAPIWFGCKLQKQVEKEDVPWVAAIKEK